LAAVVLATGVTVLVGWIADVPVLRSMAPGLATTDVNTALCLVLVAAALLWPTHRRAGGVACMVACALALATLVEHLARWNLHIDQLLLHDHDVLARHPGRMPVSLATGIAIFASAVIVSRSTSRARRVVAEAAVAVVGVWAWVALLGYFFGIRALRHPGPLDTIAVPSAAGLLLLAIAAAKGVPDGLLVALLDGQELGHVTMRRFLPMALVGIPVMARIRLTAEHAGWIGPEFSLSLMVLASSTVVLAVALYNSRRLTQVDGERLAVRTRLEATIEQLAASEQHLRRLTETAPIGIFEIGRGGRYLYVNPTWSEVFGVSKDDALSNLGAVRDAVHPDDVGDVERAWRQASALREPLEIDFRVRRADGTVRWIHLRSLPNQARSADQARYIGTVEDDTVRRARQARVTSAFETAPIGMAVLDVDGQIVRANPALATMVGYDRDVLAAMRFVALSHPDDPTDVGPPSGAARIEKRLVRSDGSTVWVTIHWAEASTDEGAPFFVYQIVDITEQRLFEAQLSHMANHDALTGLLNRRSFEVGLAQHVARVDRYGPEGALLLLDLDHFKKINDTFGHGVGDQIILTTAHALRRRLRSSDLLARLGGDEFAVLVPHGGLDEAREIARTLLDEIRSTTTDIAGHPIALTTSIGVAMFDDHRRSAEEMIVNADLAMYDAKDEGRDRWREFSSELYDEPRTKSRLTWLNRIEQAIAHDGFTMFGQPIVDLATGEITQIELLIRMLGEHGDLILPGTFLYIAERFGLITQIDELVVNRALELLERLGRTAPELTIAVNLSGPSLTDGRVIQTIASRAAAGRIEPRQLVLEITETSAIANIAAARAFAEQMHDIGCRVALDDFGAGFGSFYYLKHLPFDYIKIDGEFINNCLNDRTDQAIIQSLVDLSRNLGKETIAEHVPNDDTVQFLRRLGVDLGQGFHLGRPVPVEDAVAPHEARSSESTSARTRET
jgi:diguanylate cyclase (GGDEF)-like protein/PAS domain S-box-containing protein